MSNLNEYREFSEEDFLALEAVDKLIADLRADFADDPEIEAIKVKFGLRGQSK